MRQIKRVSKLQLSLHERELKEEHSSRGSLTFPSPQITQHPPPAHPPWDLGEVVESNEWIFLSSISNGKRKRPSSLAWGGVCFPSMLLASRQRRHQMPSYNPAHNKQLSHVKIKPWSLQSEQGRPLPNISHASLSFSVHGRAEHLKMSTNIPRFLFIGETKC